MKDWNKYIFIIALVLLFYFFGNRYGKFIGKRNTADEKKKQQEVDDFGFTSENVNKTNLTYPPEKYKTLADQLDKSFNFLDNLTFGIINNFNSIYAVFAQLQTDDDMKQLIIEYGTPLDTPDWGFGWFLNFKRRNLVETVHEHMNKKQIAKLNELFVSKNMTFRF
ncbi:MAG: hypothetical protein PHP31_07590 [Lentimicrobiaceae bacterium]|nr:hypothetical protein [Lentimicrobiaceae bacterium]